MWMPRAIMSWIRSCAAAIGDDDVKGIIDERFAVGAFVPVIDGLVRES